VDVVDVVDVVDGVDEVDVVDLVMADVGTRVPVFVVCHAFRLV
jgi:hypothetical protein